MMTSSTPSMKPTSNAGNKQKWSRMKCISRMINVLVHTREEFIYLDKKHQRYQLDAVDVDWYWRRAASEINDKDIYDIEYYLFKDEEAHRQEMSKLDPPFWWFWIQQNKIQNGISWHLFNDFQSLWEVSALGSERNRKWK